MHIVENFRDAERCECVSSMFSRMWLFEKFWVLVDAGGYCGRFRGCERMWVQTSKILKIQGDADANSGKS